MSRKTLVLAMCVALWGIAEAEVVAAEPATAMNPAAVESAAPFRFVVMGDNRPWWRGADIVTQNEHFLANIERANAAGADLTVIAGDLIHGHTDDAALLGQMWDAYDEACKRFEMPVYHVVGNHDTFGEPSQNVWRERRGDLYFSWDHKGCHFIALDSEVVGATDSISGDQLDWLRKDLEAAKSARRIFVFLHKPLWAFEPKPGEGINQWDRDVHPLLARCGVDTVFAGHWHQYTLHPTRDGVRYVVTGGAGAELRGPELEGGFFHILTVDVAGASSEFRVVTARGEVPTDYVTPESVAALRSALSVEPLRGLPEDGEVTIRAHLANPVRSEVTLRTVWETADTSWQAESQEFAMPAGGQADLAIRARVGKLVFPAPKGTIEMGDGERKLFAWPFVPQAVSGIGPLVREWSAVGPFEIGFRDATEQERMDMERFVTTPRPGWDGTLPPEEVAVDLNVAFAGKDGRDVRWTPVTAPPDGLVDLDKLYNAEDYAVGYAVSYVYSPDTGMHQMTVGSDDSILVRINEQEVWRHDLQRGAEPDQDAFEAELRQGWNELFVKVAERWGGWGFYFRIVDPDGGLTFARVPRMPAAVPASAAAKQAVTRGEP